MWRIVRLAFRARWWRAWHQQLTAWLRARGKVVTSSCHYCPTVHSDYHLGLISELLHINSDTNAFYDGRKVDNPRLQSSLSYICIRLCGTAFHLGCGQKATWQSSRPLGDVEYVINNRTSLLELALSTFPCWMVPSFLIPTLLTGGTFLSVARLRFNIIIGEDTYYFINTT